MHHGINAERLLASITDGAYLVDREGYLISANAAWLRKMEMKEKLVLGRHIKDVLWDYSFSHELEETSSMPYEGGDIACLEALESGKTVIHASSDLRRRTAAYPVLDRQGEMIAVCTLEWRQTSEPTVDELVRTTDSELHNGGMIGSSVAMERLRGVIREVAPTDTTVMIMGETGVGKEVAASEIQKLSMRKNAPFIRINCAAIPETLLESELFGHESGAFTGAVKGGKTGLLELANQGTVLFDEIGELPLSMQPKLLRAIQEQAIFRVGGSRPIPTDIRILAATNRDLSQMVAQKLFREDLYYRLNVIPLPLPPLRERGEDIILLAERFLREFNTKYRRQKSFAKSALNLMREYRWPGNIRELRNLVERLVILSSGGQIGAEDVQRILAPQLHPDVAEVGQLSLRDATEQFQRAVIEDALSRYGSTYKAATALDTSQSTLARKARQFGIQMK